MTTISINQLSANAKSLDISTSRAAKLLSVDEKQATVTTLWEKIKDFFGGNNREAAFAQLHKIIHQAPRDDGNQNLECLESFQTLAALASPTNTSLFTMKMSLQEGRNVTELCIGFDVIKTLNLSAVESQQLAAFLGYSQDRLEGELLANPLKDHLKTVNTDNVNNNSFGAGGVHKKYFKGMLKAMDLVGNADFILEKKIADYIEKKPNKNELKAVISLQEQILTPSHLDDKFTYAVVPVYNDKHVKSAELDVSMATLSRDEAENLAQQAINLLRILYTSKISHDDLHMHNLMVHKVDNGAVILQAIDFGRGKVEEDFKPYTDINYMFKRQGTNIAETVTRNYLLPDSSEIKLKHYPLHYLLAQCSDRSMRDITSLLDKIGTDLVAELKTAGEGSTEIDLAFFNASNTIKQIYSPPSIPIPITSLGKKNLHGEVQSPTSKSSNVHNNLAYHHTSLGSTSNVNVGKGLTTILKWLTLSAPARKIGNAIQDGNDSRAQSTKDKARYWIGAIIKGLANITGGVSSAISGVVSACVSVVSNLVDVCTRPMKSLWSGGQALWSGFGAKEFREAAKTEIEPSFVQKAKQETLTSEGARQVIDAAELAKVSCSSHYRQMPKGYQHASHNDIPKSVLAKRADSSGGTGKSLTLHVVAGSDTSPPLLLKSDMWSALKVAVYKRDDTLILSFVGTQPSKRPATLKSDVAAVLGIKDSAFQDADKLVGEFIKMHHGKVELIGHSLGGGIAQYAGIKHGVKVNAFNSIGLHVNLRDRLADKLNSANITHVNTSHDLLSQVFENGYSGLDASSQVGKRYVIANSGGHRIGNVLEGLKLLV